MELNIDILKTRKKHKKRADRALASITILIGKGTKMAVKCMYIFLGGNGIGRKIAHCLCAVRVDYCFGPIIFIGFFRFLVDNSIGFVRFFCLNINASAFWDSLFPMLIYVVFRCDWDFIPSVVLFYLFIQPDFQWMLLHI